jgi:prophage regulatory protein
MEEDRFIREPEVKRLTGLSRTTRWRLEREGKFPSRRQLSENAVAWLDSEVRLWIESRAASSTPSKAACPPPANRGHGRGGGGARTGNKRSITEAEVKALQPLLTPPGQPPSTSARSAKPRSPNMVSRRSCPTPTP